MKRIQAIIRENIEIKEAIFSDSQLLVAIEKVTNVCISTFQQDGKIFFCGNGGSAADAQHLAAEFSGCFYLDRAPLFAEALHVNASYLTAIANDHSFDKVYARLIQAKARKGDILFGISTSGNSTNVVQAFEQAKLQEVITIGMTGATGGQLKPLSDYLLAIPSNNTPRIQEAHIMVGHIICELVEQQLFSKTVVAEKEK